MSETHEFTYPYPRPSVTVDVAVFALGDEGVSVLWIRRAGDPCKGRWALPGGFVEPDETLESAAARELREETGVRVGELWPIGGFGDPGRDPRGWTVSMAYYALTWPADAVAQAGDDAGAVAWSPIEKPPALAFDHRKILRSAVARLRVDLYALPIARSLLPKPFQFSAYHDICRRIDPRAPSAAALKRAVLANGLLVGDEEESLFRFATLRRS